jgi:hypothetical protein
LLLHRADKTTALQRKQITQATSKHQINRLCDGPQTDPQEREWREEGEKKRAKRFHQTQMKCVSMSLTSIKQLALINTISTRAKQTQMHTNANAPHNSIRERQRKKEEKRRRGKKGTTASE